jgi:hypothetical protein
MVGLGDGTDRRTRDQSSSSGTTQANEEGVPGAKKRVGEDPSRAAAIMPPRPEEAENPFHVQHSVYGCSSPAATREAVGDGADHARTLKEVETAFVWQGISLACVSCSWGFALVAIPYGFAPNVLPIFCITMTALWIGCGERARKAVMRHETARTSAPQGDPGSDTGSEC